MLVLRCLGVAVTVGRARRVRFGGRSVSRRLQSYVFVDRRWGWVEGSVSDVVDVDKGTARTDAYRMTLVES